jgi:hypothetical protein
MADLISLYCSLPGFIRLSDLKITPGFGMGSRQKGFKTENKKLKGKNTRFFAFVSALQGIERQRERKGRG